jgi:hypothetical protein
VQSFNEIELRYGRLRAIQEHMKNKIHAAIIDAEST